MTSKTIKAPYDYFLRDWEDSGNHQVIFSISEVGSNAILQGGIVREINNDNDIFIFKKMFQYFIEEGYAKIDSKSLSTVIYELTNKGREHSNYVKQAKLIF